MTRQDLADESPAAPRARRSDHAVHFYEDDESLVAVVAEFLSNGLLEGEPVLVVATWGHRRAFVERLRRKGHDIDDPAFSAEVRLLDADALLTAFMIGDAPDQDLFRDTVGRTVHQLANGGRKRLRVYGEMVDLLWRRGKTDAALQLERFWNDLGRTYSFSLLCAYAMGGFFGQGLAEQISFVCATHSRLVLADDDRSEVPGSDDGGILLDQIRSLEVEIAQRRQLEAALRDALDERRRTERELRAALEMKDEFLSAVSHELRAPLQAILGWAAVLKWDSSLDERSVSEGLGVIAQSAKTQASILNNVFDLTALAAGTVMLDQHPTDLATITADVIRAAQQASSSKEIEVVFEQVDEACIAMGDNGRILQIVDGLIANAIELSRRNGRVSVRLACARNTVRLAVTDTGPGFEPAQIERVLNPSGLLYGSSGGPRMRLAIVNYLVALHGGTLEGHSEGVGRGATISVALPRAFVTE